MRRSSVRVAVRPFAINLVEAGPAGVLVRENGASFPPGSV